jgi:hypothetical protein
VVVLLLLWTSFARENKKQEGKHLSCISAIFLHLGARSLLLCCFFPIVQYNHNDDDPHQSKLHLKLCWLYCCKRRRPARASIRPTRPQKSSLSAAPTHQTEEQQDQLCCPQPIHFPLYRRLTSHDIFKQSNTKLCQQSHQKHSDWLDTQTHIIYQ